MEDIFKKIESVLQKGGYHLDRPLELKQIDIQNTYIIYKESTMQTNTIEDYKKVSVLLSSLFDENYIASNGWNVLGVKKQETFRLMNLVVKHQLERKKNTSYLLHTIKLDIV